MTAGGPVDAGATTRLDKDRGPAYGTSRTRPRRPTRPRGDLDGPFDAAFASPGPSCLRRSLPEGTPSGEARVESETPDMGDEGMRSKGVLMGLVGLAFLGLGAGVGLSVGFAQQPGVAERVGETLDNVGRGLLRGAQDLGEGVRRRFEVV